MLLSILLQAIGGIGLTKLGAAIGAGIAVLGAGIGIGRIGGSAMDAGKIMWVLYEHPEANFEDRRNPTTCV